MCRAIEVTARTLLSAIGVVGVAVMSSPVSALSHEEWVMAFVRFVEWPAPAPEETLVVCLLPDTPVLELQGKQVRGLTLQILRPSRQRELDHCHMFVAMSEREASWAPWLNAIKPRPILAVGLGARFCEVGGTICLVKDDATGAEKFQLNLDALARGGFKVNSQLLRSQPQRTAKAE